MLVRRNSSPNPVSQSKSPPSSHNAPMTWLSAVLLLLAGIGGGVAGSVAGLASLISYPALLAFGLDPVAANVTNTVALVSGGLGYAFGSRPELDSQDIRLLVKLMCAGAAGGLLGGIVLLVSPSAAFSRVVPWMIGLGSLTILIRPRPPQSQEEHHRPHTNILVAVCFLICIYVGYFGPGSGIFILAALLHLSAESFVRSKAIQNLVVLTANSVAAVYFVVSGPVHWAPAIPLAVGFWLGGRSGPIIVRRAPVGLLKMVIAAAGLVTAIKLGVSAYG
jgi:uncharacterized protein